MAMPMAGSGGPGDDERTTNVDSYRITCMDFISEISHDYLAWVDRYALPAEEDAVRRGAIDSTIKKTNYWIAKVAQSIRAVDVVMNDGIQKMAEATAGRPFPIGVFVNKTAGYAASKPGIIDVAVRASGREGRPTRLGFHFKDARFRLESTAPALIDESALPAGDYAMLDASLRLDASACSQRDVISFTVTVAEVIGGQEADKRGVSTIIHIV